MRGACFLVFLSACRVGIGGIEQESSPDPEEESFILAETMPDPSVICVSEEGITVVGCGGRAITDAVISYAVPRESVEHSGDDVTFGVCDSVTIHGMCPPQAACVVDFIVPQWDGSSFYGRCR